MAQAAARDDGTGYAAIAHGIDGEERAYLRRRHLMDGPGARHIDFVGETADRLAAALGGDGAGFLDWALENRTALKRITLNASALLALRGGQWDHARDLAGEVTARDHHDLMAQRIIDAAAERAADLITETDRWLATRVCEAPFRQIETRANRTVHFCCSAWQPVPIGRIDDPAAPETGQAGFWTSPVAEEIRRSVTQGDFSHCSRWHCPAIVSRRLPRAPGIAPDPAAARLASPAVIAPPPVLEAGTGPKRVILSHDRSCNISCPSCRTKLILADHQTSARLDKMFETTLLPFLDEAEQIKVTGSGDPFGSRHFRQVLRMLCQRGPARRRLQLHTNGLLANDRAWDELGLWDNVTSVWVSADAATPGTYAELRRGGEFGQLVSNLHFLGSLRRSGAIDSLRLDFVVQQRNYDEMGDFVELAQRVGADRVYFLRLRNWGHYTSDEFRGMDVCDPGHEEHGALLARLTDPRLAQGNVALGSMAALHRTATSGRFVA